MTFKQIMMEKLKENVACKLAHDDDLISEVASAVIDDLDYADIASMLAISDSDIADEIDAHDLLSEIGSHIDMDDLREAVVDKCDLEALAEKISSMLPSTVMDDIAIQAAEEIVAEMDAGNSAT